LPDVPMSRAVNTNLEFEHPPVTIIGTGPVGRSIGWAFFQAGYPITSVIGLEADQVRYLRKQLQAKVGGQTVEEIPERTQIFVLAVPDDQIAAVAKDLAQLDFLNDRRIAMHCSGALGADVMESLTPRGVHLLSFHPMISFARGSRRRSFRNISVGVEGNQEAVAIGFDIAKKLGLTPVEIPTKMKICYHLAGVWASNFLAAILSQAVSLMKEIVHDRNESWVILEPLVEGTLGYIKRLGIEGAITGPAMRGDIGTINRHLDFLINQHPELLPIYRELTKTIITTLVKDLGPEHQHMLKALKDSKNFK
jgi:predicted short-subunit dehydrogenase-like oxidoreductase (DUF2520 family)